MPSAFSTLALVWRNTREYSTLTSVVLCVFHLLLSLFILFFQLNVRRFLRICFPREQRNICNSNNCYLSHCLLSEDSSKHLDHICSFGDVYSTAVFSSLSLTGSPERRLSCLVCPNFTHEFFFVGCTSMSCLRDKHNLAKRCRGENTSIHFDEPARDFIKPAIFRPKKIVLGGTMSL